MATQMREATLNSYVSCNQIAIEAEQKCRDDEKVYKKAICKILIQTHATVKQGALSYTDGQ